MSGPYTADAGIELMGIFEHFLADGRQKCIRHCRYFRVKIGRIWVEYDLAILLLH